MVVQVKRAAWRKKRNFEPKRFMLKKIETKQNSIDKKNAQDLPHCLPAAIVLAKVFLGFDRI